MKKKRLLIALITVFTVQLFSLGSVFADYDPSGDITLDVTLLEDQLQFSDSTGDATFELQEGVHSTLTDTTGLNVNHSYIWIKINGSRVIGIDPPKLCF